MDIALRLLNGLLMLALPLGLGVFLARRLGQRWRLYLAGAVTFIASQALHLPFNFALLNPRLEFGQGELTAGVILSAALLGISAGVFEETARYLVLRFWRREARSWRQALMFGAGHGGVEAILLGIIVLLTLMQMIAYRGADLSTIVPAEQLELAQQQVEAYWAGPHALALLGAMERAFALCLHLSATVMVMRGITHDNRWWLAAAIGWHALIDASAVLSLPLLGPVATDAIVGVLALISVWIVLRLREEQPQAQEIDVDAAPPPSEPLRGPIPAGERSVEASRFTES